MTNKNTETAAHVISSFLDELSKDEAMNQDIVAVITKLHSEGQLTRTNLLSQLEKLRDFAPDTDSSQDDFLS